LNSSDYQDLLFFLHAVDKATLQDSKVVVINWIGDNPTLVLGASITCTKNIIKATNTHHDGCKTLGVIFGIPGVGGDGLKVKSTVKVHGGDDVLESTNDTLNSGDVLLFKSKGNLNRRRWKLRRGGRLGERD
jgi:hypothetical protein